MVSCVVPWILLHFFRDLAVGVRNYSENDLKVSVLAEDSLNDVSLWKEVDWIGWAEQNKKGLAENWLKSGLLPSSSQCSETIVMTDLDGTLSPFPDLQQQQLLDGWPYKNWLAKSTEALSTLKAKRVTVMVSTGNTLGMVHDRYSDELDSGVFAGGADVRWHGEQVNLPDGHCLDCLTEDVVKATVALQDKHPDFLCIWMTEKTYYMDERAMVAAYNEGETATVWDDAKHYLSANVPDGTPAKKAVMDKFDDRVKDIRNRSSGEDGIQVLYIKGFGKGKKDVVKLRVMLTDMFPEFGNDETSLDPLLEQSGKSYYSGIIGSSNVTLIVMQTSGRWEVSVMKKGVTKESGQTALNDYLKTKTSIKEFRNNVALIAGDSKNDIANAAAVLGGSYPNAIFVATANQAWVLSPAVTGLKGVQSPLTPESILKEESSKFSSAETKEAAENNKRRIIPGFVFDAMLRLAEECS